MALRLAALSADTAPRLEEIERTPSAPSWLTKVEDAALGELAAGALLRSGDAVLLACDDAAALVGIVVHGPDRRWLGASYIKAIVVDHRYRGNGYGTELLDEIVSRVRNGGSPHAVWMVHSENIAMLKVSRSRNVDEYATGDYAVFVEP